MRSQIAEREKLEKELHLKQLQIKSLLTITQAINDNVSAQGLYNMYKSFLNWEMGVKKMALFIKSNGSWDCTSNINIESIYLDTNFGERLTKYQRLHKINEQDDPLLQVFDIVIPVYHKEQPIAYSLIGECGENEDIYSKIQFITTITNIVAVAIENKRLFKQQLERERLKREIELASEVQKMLIPSILPKGKGFELDSIYKPHFNIGGDYFDYIMINEHKFVLCIADISGKGVAAALLMSNIQATIRNLVKADLSLVDIVKQLNSRVFELTRSDKFLTFFIAHVCLKDKKLNYINAGHFPPLLYQGGKVQMLRKGCTIIGAFEQLEQVDEGTIPINQETLLLTFTDGLTDLQNDHGKYFDEDQLSTFIEKNHALNAAQFNNALMKEITSFSNGNLFPDDIAVLTCKLFGT